MQSEWTSGTDAPKQFGARFATHDCLADFFQALLVRLLAQPRGQALRRIRAEPRFGLAPQHSPLPIETLLNASRHARSMPRWMPWRIHGSGQRLTRSSNVIFTSSKVSCAPRRRPPDAPTLPTDSPRPRSTFPRLSPAATMRLSCSIRPRRAGPRLYVDAHQRGRCLLQCVRRVLKIEADGVRHAHKEHVAIPVKRDHFAPTNVDARNSGQDHGTPRSLAWFYIVGRDLAATLGAHAWASA